MLSYEYPPIGSGAGLVGQALATAWVQQGMQCTVLTSALGGDASTSSESGVEVVRLATGRKRAHRASPLDMLRWAYQARAWVNRRLERRKEERPWDLQLANFVVPGGMLALSLQQRFALPYVVLTHGHDVPGAAPKEMRFYHALLGPYMRKIIRHASFSVALNPELKTLLDRAVPERAARHVVLPNGMEQVRPKDRMATPGPLRLVWAGRLVPQKRPDLFLDALLQFREPFEASIYGDGPLKEKLRKRVQAMPPALQKQIQLKGRVPRATLLEALDHAHGLVMSSEFEAMSMVALEAIASGAWVISPRVGGVDAWLEPGLNGECLKSATATALAESLRRLQHRIRDSGLQYSPDYRESLEEQFSWDRIAERYRALFAKTLAEAPEAF